MSFWALLWVVAEQAQADTAIRDSVHAIDNESLSGSKGDSYSRDIQIITRNQAGKETYTFTVINRDGLRNAVGLTLTVQ